MKHSHDTDHAHGADHSHQLSVPKQPWTDWLPLLVVIMFICGSTAILMYLTEVTFNNLLTYSMGFFFTYFALFKLINLPGFAMGYQEYDLIASRYKLWGWAYPFVEVLLGVLYLLRVDLIGLHVFTIIVTAIACLGVGIKLAKREVFQCACLGTVLKVPLTKVSLVEYAAMGVMALAMIFV